jgi:hypothetical protein
MGKTIFAAIVAAVVASIATVLLMNSFQAERAAEDEKTRKLAADTAQVERERVERRIASLEKQTASAQRADRRGAGDGASSAAGTSAGGTAPQVDVASPGALAPDGTPYVSRKEMEAYAQAQAALLGLSSSAPMPATPIEKKSLADIAAEMGLTAGEEANLRELLRAAEEEMVHNICGDRSLDEVKRLVREAKEDPDQQAALAQEGFGHAIQNVGKLATWDSRLRLRVEKAIGKDRATTFLAKPRKPVIDADLDDLLREWK